jgi:CO/xanthine dehydrogenase Mo-binding subunit
VGFREVLDRVAAAADWDQKRAAFAGDTGPKRRGLGIACSYYGVGLGAMGKHLNPAGANLVVSADGSVTVAVGTTEIGQGMVSVLTQITAEALGCPPELVRVVEADTSRVPDSGPTVASRTTVMSGNAIQDAARRIREEMARVEAAEGRPWKDAVALCVKHQVGLAAHGWSVPPETTFDLATGKGQPICYSFSANVVEAEVDTETGETRVLRVVSGHDCGKVVNPTTVEGQIEGGVVQGLGYALTEEHHLKDGRIQNDQFSTYIIPTPMDTPEIQSLIVEAEYPWGPYGAKGLGRRHHRRGPRGHRSHRPRHRGAALRIHPRACLRGPAEGAGWLNPGGGPHRERAPRRLRVRSDQRTCSTCATTCSSPGPRRLRQGECGAAPSSWTADPWCPA